MFRLSVFYFVVILAPKERNLSLFFKLFIYLEKERARAGEGQRERVPSRLHTVSAEPDAGLDPTNHGIMT